MKQKIYDIPIWDAYGIENIECPMCEVEKNMESSFMDVLFDDMLMTPYFAVKLQQYTFCREHFRKLYIYKDKLGLALIVNNFLQCQKDELQVQPDGTGNQKSQSLAKKIRNVFSKKKHIHTRTDKRCYLCEKIDENIPDYIEVLIRLWNKNADFKNLYSKSKGHCLRHYNMLITDSEKYLSEKSYREFKSVTVGLQLDNTKRLIDELDWFVCKYDYRYKEEPWKNSKDALPRCINKITGHFNE
jgi:hypothetical protein